MANWIGRWAGGPIAQRKDGRKVFYIERMVDHRRFLIALRVVDEAAEGELALFNRDPRAYVKRRNNDRERSGAVLTVDTVGDFLDHLKEKGRSLKYRNGVHYYLGEWMDWFAGRPVPEVTAAQLAKALAKWGNARRNRTIVLKSFATWLRTEQHLLSRGEDPTLDILVPQAVPEKTIRDKGHSLNHVEIIYRFVEEQDVRDVICLRAHTGMHESEASRIATRNARFEPVENGGEIAGVLVFPHKSGNHHRQSVSAQPFAAALRLAATGRPIENKRQQREIARACEHLREILGHDFSCIMPGEFRHSFTTWAGTFGREIKLHDSGVPRARVAEAIGHESSRTTNRFYDGTRVPAMIAVPLRLFHPDDPPIPSAFDFGSQPTGSSGGARASVDRWRRRRRPSASPAPAKTPS